MDPDELRDYEDQGPLPDREMEEDNQILASLLKHILCCETSADISILLYIDATYIMRRISILRFLPIYSELLVYVL